MSQEAADRWLEKVCDIAKRSIWAIGGCASWYLDKEGVPVLYQTTIAEFAEELREPDFSDFVIEPLMTRGRDRLPEFVGS